MLILCFTGGVLLLFLAGRLLVFPLKRVLGLLFNSLMGAAAITAINAVGASASFHIPLNPLNAVLTGVFGIPGVLLIIALGFMDL